MPSPQGDFTVDSRIHAWVDGSCLQQPNGSLLIGWAYLIIDKGKEIHREAGNEIPEGAQQHRNVAGEIVAVLKAVSWCQSQGISLITVYHDYQGLASWSTGEWKTKTPLTQYYAHTIGTSGLDIHWKKVKAHSGEPNNELVDQLAKEAALKPEKRKYQKPL
jgi:ribonuclease HI